MIDLMKPIVIDLTLTYLLHKCHHVLLGCMWVRIISYSFSVSLLLLILSSYYLLIFPLAANSNAQTYEIPKNGTLKSEHKKMEAYGRIAANQIQNGSVSWIQAGLWYMTIVFNDLDNNTKDAYFYTDFTMVKPDGSSLHKHFIKNFKPTSIDLLEEKITIKGMADIYSGKSPEYSDIPLTVDLRNETVLGLVIDKYKTQQHFASSSTDEIFGILIDSMDFDKLTP